MEAFQLVGVQFSMERAPAHPQFFSRLSAAAVALFECANDQLLFRFFHAQIGAGSDRFAGGKAAGLAANARW